MARYVNLNLNSLPLLNNESTGIFSRIMSTVSTTTLIIIGLIMLFAVVAVVYYYYYVIPSSKSNYHANNEKMPLDQRTSNNAELLFFYANWCPHCKSAKPIWNDLKTEYENKTINGYKVIFTDIDCSEETSEVEKLMNQYNIEGYPTIKLIKDGQVIEYDAKPSKEMLTKFLNTVL
jgi:thiol-disulfide isomerase/thioredoxin